MVPTLGDIGARCDSEGIVEEVQSDGTTEALLARDKYPDKEKSDVRNLVISRFNF